MQSDKVGQLWQRLHQLAEKFRQLQMDNEKKSLYISQLEDKLKSKESDLNQIRMLSDSTRQSYDHEKREIETQIRHLIEKIDHLSGEK